MSTLINKTRGEIEANIYRLAHHGAYSGYTGTKQPNRPDLLKAVGASYYFSSSGLDDTDYGHPRCQLYREILSNHIYPVLEHPYTFYEDNGTKDPSPTDKPIYVTTVEENGHRKDYVIRFAIKDSTIEPTITPFDGTLKERGRKKRGHKEL